MNGSLLCLPIFLPIVVGAISYFLPFSATSLRRRHLFFTVVICLTTVLAWLAILRCDGGSFTLLTFSKGWTLTFRMDGASRIFAGLSSSLWPVTMVYAFDYMAHYMDNPKRLNTFWAFFTMSFGVTLGIAFAANMLTMYLFYEMLTLATLPLVMHVMSKKAIAAGKKYLFYSMSGAALAFIGLVFLITQGAQDFTYGGHLAAYAGSKPLMLVVFTLAFAGFGVKAALWPFHDWLPTAAVAPTPVTALLHAVAVVKAGAFACLRLVYYSFGPDILRGTWAQYVTMGLAIFTIVYGSAMALKQEHFKRRLAYSTVSNLSYILFALMLLSEAGLTAAYLHLLVHSVIKIACFFVAGAVLHYAEREYLDELEGLGRKMPLSFACFTVCAVALTGIPPLNGFISKWYIALAAAESRDPMSLIGLAALLLSALLTSIYMFQIVIPVWFPRRGTALPENARESSPFMWVPLVVLTVVCVLMGLFPQSLLDIIGKVVTFG